MANPGEVRCTWCLKTYNVMDVHVIARYSDCSVWRCPHCKARVDDRTWKGIPDYHEVTDNAPIFIPNEIYNG